MTFTPLMTRDGEVHLESLPVTALSAEILGDSLSKINRYAGRTAQPFSVAAHSVLVSRLCPRREEQAWGLLHDAHEAFIGDIITPALRFIASQSRPVAGNIVENCVREAKAGLDRQIRAAWGIAPEDVDFDEVARYDRIALEAEMFMFFGAMPGADPTGDLDRAIEILRDLPGTGNWQTAGILWCFEAQSLAQAGACSLPASKNDRAA